MYANNCYISHSDDDGILDMSHIAESQQSLFDYKAMHFYSNMMPSMVDGQPDELEKLTIFGISIAADDPDLFIMH